MSVTDPHTLRNQYNERLRDLTKARDGIVGELRDNLSSIEFIDAIYGRVKSKESFCKKVMEAPEKYRNPFVSVEDLIGIRILVLTSSVSKRVHEFICENVLSPIEHRYQQEESAKSFGYEGYQSIHQIPKSLASRFSWDGFPQVFELQIRTLFQHASFEPEHEFNYKRQFKLDEEGEFEYQKFFSWIASTSWGAERILDKLYTTY